MFKSLCLIVENLRICNLRTGSPTRFLDLQFADQWKEICGLAYLRNLRICDCGLSPRICGFKKTVAWPATFANLLKGLGETDSLKNLKSKIFWHYPCKLSFCMYKIVQSENHRFTLSFLATGNYIPWLNLLKGPCTHTDTSDVSIF
jgi:hypothetical protein